MSDLTIPDALADDLRDIFLATQPLDPELPDAAVRLKLDASGEPPSPRLLILCGDPQRISGQDGTARIPFELQYISSMDRETPEDHRAAAGLIDEWLREVRITYRRDVISSRVWLHDLYNRHAQFTIAEDGREQIAHLRGEALVTLATVTVVEEE
jgi:hypothetical protein